MKTQLSVTVVGLAAFCMVTAVAQVPAPSTLSRSESKRDVADKLLSLAEEYKEQSLHDVLRDKKEPSHREGATVGSSKRGAKEKSERSGDKKVASVVVRKIELPSSQGRKEGEDSSQPGDVSRDVTRAAEMDKRFRRSRRQSGESPKVQGARSATAAKAGRHVVVNTWSEQFARGANGTVRHSELAAYVNISAMVVSAAELRPRISARSANLPEVRRPTEDATVLLRSPGSNLLSPAEAPPSGAQLPVTLPVLAALNELELDDAEAGVMLRALRVLRASPVDEIDARVKALLILEEVCCFV